VSLYQVQKLLFHVLSDAALRREYRQSPEVFARRYTLEDLERAAVLKIDIRTLYQMGVDPLLLRPFTELNGIESKDHYAALKGLECRR
jgi:hypothetical protein